MAQHPLFQKKCCHKIDWRLTATFGRLIGATPDDYPRRPARLRFAFADKVGNLRETQSKVRAGAG